MKTKVPPQWSIRVRSLPSGWVVEAVDPGGTARLRSLETHDTRTRALKLARRLLNAGLEPLPWVWRSEAEARRDMDIKAAKKKVIAKREPLTIEPFEVIPREWYADEDKP